MSAEVARVLREAADLIKPPGRWTRGVQARNDVGQPVSPLSPKAHCWCMVGAVRRVAGTNDHLMHGALDQLRANLGLPGPSTFNDARDSAEPVVARLRRVADEAEAS